MTPRHELVTNSIAPRIKAVLAAAEQTAALVAEEAETAAGHRAAEIIALAEADAERIRREATRRVEEYLSASRQRVDAFATARIERITELSENVIEAVGGVQERFEQATAVQREVHAMIEALGSVAEAIGAEAAQASPMLPPPPAALSRAKSAPGGGDLPEGLAPALANGRLPWSAERAGDGREEDEGEGEQEDDPDSGIDVEEGGASDPYDGVGADLDGASQSGAENEVQPDPDEVRSGVGRAAKTGLFGRRRRGLDGEGDADLDGEGHPGLADERDVSPA